MFPIKKRIGPARVAAAVSGLARDVELSKVCDRDVYTLSDVDVVFVSITGKGLVGSRASVLAWVSSFSGVCVPDCRDTFQELSASGDRFLADALPGCAAVLQRALRLPRAPAPMDAVRLFDSRWTNVFERRVLRRTPLFDAVVGLIGEAAVHVLGAGTWRIGAVVPGVRHPTVVCGERVFDPVHVIDQRVDRGLGYSIEAALWWNGVVSDYDFGA